MGLEPGLQFFRGRIFEPRVGLEVFSDRVGFVDVRITCLVMSALLVEPRRIPLILSLLFRIIRKHMGILIISGPTSNGVEHIIDIFLLFATVSFL